MLIFIALYLLKNINFKGEMNKKEFRIKMVDKLRHTFSSAWM